MTDTTSTTPSPENDTPMPADVAALIDDAYAQGLDYGPDLHQSTMRLLAKDGTVLREVHWPGIRAWASNLLSNVLPGRRVSQDQIAPVPAQEASRA